MYKVRRAKHVLNAQYGFETDRPSAVSRVFVERGINHIDFKEKRA